jgi:response regulator NasT
MLPQNRDVTELKILIVDESSSRRVLIEDGLREAGLNNIRLVADMTGLLEKIYKFDPDVLIIDLGNPGREVLEQMFQVSRLVRLPIAMFVDESDGATIEAAINAGVSAYVVDGLRKERVRAVLEIAFARFRALEKLRLELEEAKNALKDRKTIEKAKGILMKTRGLDEEAAYAAMRRQAMSNGSRIVDVATALISTFELLHEK